MFNDEASVYVLSNSWYHQYYSADHLPGVLPLLGLVPFDAPVFNDANGFFLKLFTLGLFPLGALIDCWYLNNTSLSLSEEDSSSSSPYP